MSKPATIYVNDERYVFINLRTQLTHHLGNNSNIELAERGEDEQAVIALKQCELKSSN
jgi:hypothetical protein